MNESYNELNWIAFRYAAGEMEASECDAFEMRLADDQAARDALARTVLTAEAAGEALACSSNCQPATVSPAIQANRPRRYLPTVVASIVAAALLTAVLVNLPHRSSAPQDNRVGSGAEAKIDAASAGKLVSIWVDAEASATVKEEAALVKSRSLEIDQSVEEEPAEGEFDWMVAAVCAGEDEDGKGEKQREGQYPMRTTICCLACLVISVSAAEDNSRTRATAVRKPRTNTAVMTPAREAAALKFAELHHPELAELLKKLKTARRSSWKRGVRQLYIASERLARTKERQPERYQTALNAWKLDSRIRLLSARATMGDDPETQRELNRLVNERIELRLADYRAEQKRLQDRLDKVNAQIKSIETDRDTTIARELIKAKRSIGVAVKKTPRNKRPATVKTSK